MSRGIATSNALEEFDNGIEQLIENIAAVNAQVEQTISDYTNYEFYETNKEVNYER